MQLRGSAVVEDRRRSLTPGLEQGSQKEVAEGSKLKLQQENREGGENSKVLTGVGSPPSIAMPGELQGGSRDSGASPHIGYSEIPPSPPPQATVQDPDRAAVGICNAAGVAVPTIDSVKSKHTRSPPEDCVDDCKLLTRPKGSSSAEGRITDSHDLDGLSKNLDLVAPAPNEDEHGSRSQLQMPRAKGRSGRSAPMPWASLPCQHCKSTNFSICTYANADSVVNRMHYECNNCKHVRKYVRSYKMRNRKPSQLAAPNSNAEAMPPLSNPNMKLMPPPSYTQKPNVRLPDSQATSSAKTTLPQRTSSCSDMLEDDHPSRESNLQQVVAPESQARFPMNILDAMGPFPLGANLKEPPSNQFVKGSQKEVKELSFAKDGFSVTGLRDSIRVYRSSPLEENKNGSGGGTVSDGGRSSNGLPCSSCKSTNTRFCWSGCHFCNNCRAYWDSNFGQLQHHEVQLPSKQFSKGKEKEKEKETPYDNADQFSGKDLGDSSRGPPSLPLQVREDGNCGSNQGPLNAPSCSRCKSTFTRLCTYGVFCDACGKHSPFAGTRDPEVPENPPVAMVQGIFDADSPSREHQMQSLPPPRRPKLVDASTQTDPVAMVDASTQMDVTDPVAMVPAGVARVPVDDRRFGKHIEHGLLRTHNHEQVAIDERKRRRVN